MQVTGYRMTSNRSGSCGQNICSAVVGRARALRRERQKLTDFREMAYMSVAETTVRSAADTAERSIVEAFTVLGTYLVFDAMGVATGGRALPLGRPVIKA
jgi:hypothetical protein